MKRILLLLILSVCLLPLWPQETVTPVKPLSARIDALIEHKLPAGSNVAISVYDLTAGKPLYGYQADKLSRPASTMKLLTTITALSVPKPTSRSVRKCGIREPLSAIPCRGYVCDRRLRPGV